MQIDTLVKEYLDSIEEFKKSVYEVKGKTSEEDFKLFLKEIEEMFREASKIGIELIDSYINVFTGESELPIEEQERFKNAMTDREHSTKIETVKQGLVESLELIKKISEELNIPWFGEVFSKIIERLIRLIDLAHPECK